MALAPTNAGFMDCFAKLSPAMINFANGFAQLQQLHASLREEYERDINALTSEISTLKRRISHTANRRISRARTEGDAIRRSRTEGDEFSHLSDITATSVICAFPAPDSVDTWARLQKRKLRKRTKDVPGDVAAREDHSLPEVDSDASEYWDCGADAEMLDVVPTTDLLNALFERMGHTPPSPAQARLARRRRDKKKTGETRSSNTSELSQIASQPVEIETAVPQTNGILQPLPKCEMVVTANLEFMQVPTHTPEETPEQFHSVPVSRVCSALSQPAVADAHSQRGIEGCTVGSDGMESDDEDASPKPVRP
jgi:hypothetical protein